METSFSVVSLRISVENVPTRWGSQLNGNLVLGVGHYSLFNVPTRWGSQLNGNIALDPYLFTHFLSPLAGDPN